MELEFLSGLVFYNDVAPTALADSKHAAILKSSAGHSISPSRP
jgi:hypothetical protein